MREYNTKKSNSWKKSGIKPKDISKEKFIETCINSESMAHACSKLELHFGTFRKYAIVYGCYKPNPAGQGIQKNFNAKKFSIDLWNKNEQLQITRACLRKWIFKLRLLPDICNKCGLDFWLGEQISLELNHINGKGHDNRKNNIELLCPNCHAQTENYRGKNK